MANIHDQISDVIFNLSSMFVVTETITTFDEITIKRSLYVYVLQRSNYTDEHGKLYHYKKQVCFHLQRIKASS